MVEALAKTLESLKITYLWKAFFLSALVTALIIAGLIGIIAHLLGFFEAEHSGWIGSIILWLGSATASIAAWFLYPITLPLITYLFLDNVADEVEKKFYFSKLGTPPAFWTTFPADVKLIILLIVLNILALPLYFIPVINLVVYYLLNGYLLGREFYELICMRHMSRAEAKKCRRKNRLTVILAGVLITVVATTPIANLFAPILATVFMVHLYHMNNIQR